MDEGCCGGDGDKRSARRELNEREYFHLIDKTDHRDNEHEDEETMVVGEGQKISQPTHSEVIVESMQDDFVVYMYAGKQDSGYDVIISEEKNTETTKKQLNFDSNNESKTTRPVIVNDVLSELCTDTKMEHKIFQSKLHFLPSVDVDLTKRFNNSLLEGDGLHQSILQKSDSTEKNDETTAGCLLDAAEAEINDFRKLKLSTSQTDNHDKKENYDCDVQHWICNGTWMHVTKNDEMNVQKSNDGIPVSMSDSNNIKNTQRNYYEDSLTNKIEMATLSSSSSSTTYLSLSPEIIEINTNNYISSDKINHIGQKLVFVPSTTTTSTSTTNISTNIFKDCSQAEEIEEEGEEEIYYQPAESDNDVSAPQIFNVDDMSEDDDATPGPSHSKSIVSSIYHPAHTEPLLSNDVDDDDDNSDNPSGCMSCVSGIDSDGRSLQTELMKCEGMKVSLELNHDFDGDRDGLEEEEGTPIEVDVLWANRKYIRDECGKKEITIPQDSLLLSRPLDSPCGDDDDDDDVVLEMSRRRPKNGGRQRFPNLQTTAMNSRTDVEEPMISDEGNETESSISVLSNNQSSSSVHFGGNLLVGSEDGLSFVSSSLEEEEHEVDEEESICDVEYMGRWDIFWPLMTKSQRQMVGAPSDLDLWQETETRFFIEQPHEDDSSKRDDEGTKGQGVEIEEIDESSSSHLNQQ